MMYAFYWVNQSNYTKKEARLIARQMGEKSAKLTNIQNAKIEVLDVDNNTYQVVIYVSPS